LFLFLLAYLFYIDGVNTTVKMAVDYGLSVGFEASDLITALLIVQFIGLPSAYLMGRLGSRWGAKKGIYFCLGVYVLLSLGAPFMQSAVHFYLLAVGVGLVQGGIQALSRSLFASMVPLDHS